MREGSASVADLLDIYLGELAANGQHNTVKTYRSLLRGVRDFDALTEADCRRLIAERARQSRNTAHTFAGALSSFCAWLVELGYVQESPMRRVRKPQAAKGREYGRYLRSGELGRISAVCEGSDALVVRLLLTGLRASELCGLRWADISGDTARIRGKGNTVRHIFLDADTLALLACMPRTGETVYGHGYKFLQRQIEDLGKRAGIRLHAHLFRHTWATWGKLSGMEDSALQQLGGWASTRMITTLYAVSAQQEAALDRAREAGLTRRMLGE